MTPSSNVEKILVQRGLLSAEALEQAVRLKERQGGSLAVNLVITGAIDDQTLSSFYRERYRLEPLGEDEISAVVLRTFRIIPVEIIYDFGLFPVRIEGVEGMERLVVGMIDPSEPEVLEEASFFAALELVPKLMTIGQMARHYARLTGKRWKVDWETVVARRRIYQAKVSAISEDEGEPSEDGAIVLTNPVKELLTQTAALDHSLNDIFDAEDDDEGFSRSELVIALVSVDANNLEEEEVIELTRVKNRAVSAVPGKLSLEEDARPRVKRKGRGENRWILDPAEEGEVRIKDVQPPAPAPDELPKIIVDTALLTPEEAEARVVALEMELLSQKTSRRISRATPAPVKRIEPIESDWLDTVESGAPSDDPVAAPRTLPLGSPVGKAKQAVRKDTAVPKPAAPIDADLPTTELERVEVDAAPEADAATVPGSPVPAEPDALGADAGAAWPDPDADGNAVEETKDAGPPKTEPPSTPEPRRESKSIARQGLAGGLTFELADHTHVPEDSQGFADALEGARERDEAGIAVAAYLRGVYERVVLWTLRGNSASAWIVHTGSEPDLSPARTPIDASHVDALSRAAGKLAYLGPVNANDDDATAQFEAVLGGALPLSAVTLPILIGDRQIGVIYCDCGPGEAVSVDKERLALVRSLLADALRRVILARKRRRRH